MEIESLASEVELLWKNNRDLVRNKHCDGQSGAGESAGCLELPVPPTHLELPLCCGYAVCSSSTGAEAVRAFQPHVDADGSSTPTTRPQKKHRKTKGAQQAQQAQPISDECLTLTQRLFPDTADTAEKNTTGIEKDTKRTTDERPAAPVRPEWLPSDWQAAWHSTVTNKCGRPKPVYSHVGTGSQPSVKFLFKNQVLTWMAKHPVATSALGQEQIALVAMKVEPGRSATKAKRRR